MKNNEILTMEKKKELIQLNLEMLKGILENNGMAIGFNKTDDNFMFFDREIYIKSGKFNGFQISIQELSY
jgi:hypothetical protein